MEPGVALQSYTCMNLIDAYVENIKEEIQLDSCITYNALTTVLIVTIIIWIKAVGRGVCSRGYHISAFETHGTTSELSQTPCGITIDAT